MKKEEAIKFLQQLYPNGGHCWLDEQRIEAIGMAVKALQEEPEREDLVECTSEIILDGTNFNKSWYAHPELAFKAGIKWQKTKDESTTEDLGEYINELSKQFPEVSFAKLSRIAVRVAKWQQERDEADRAAVYKCGWNDRKAMMMKKSFDAKILPTNIEETEFCLDDYEEVAIITEMVNKGEFKMGDKVKVNVIKED